VGDRLTLGDTYPVARVVERLDRAAAISLHAIDWFIPATLNTDSAALGRSRIFVATLLIAPFFGQIMNLYLFCIDPHPGLPVWIIIGLVAAFWALPFMLRLTGAYTLLTLVALETLTFITLFGAFHYGGTSSPFLPWLLNALLLALFFLGDRRWLRYAVILLVVVNLLGFYLAHSVNGGFPEHVPLTALGGLSAVSMVFATVNMSLMALYYANLMTSQSALQREARRHRATAIKLREATDEAERANRQKSEFLAKMSHELRTPLNAVIGYSEMLLEDAEADNGNIQQVADLRRINSAGKHLLSLVTDVLDLSKIEAGEMELIVAPFDFDRFVDDVVATCRPLVIENGNELVVEHRAALGAIIGDATKLRQATLNLLSNAAKFTHGGAVTLTTARERTSGGDWIAIAVRDTGIGISGETLPKLFQDFRQAEPSTASRYGGTGLGLALSQKLCRLMGGAITVESALGRGSCFTIRVPAILAAAA
jgi:signal transduction histidine kinase